MNTIPMEELKFIKFKPDPNILSETHLYYSDNFIRKKSYIILITIIFQY